MGDTLEDVTSKVYLPQKSITHPKNMVLFIKFLDVINHRNVVDLKFDGLTYDQIRVLSDMLKNNKTIKKLELKILDHFRDSLKYLTRELFTHNKNIEDYAVY